MERKVIYCELPTKFVNRVKRTAKRLEITTTKMVELALKEFMDNDPQIVVEFDARRHKKLQ